MIATILTIPRTDDKRGDALFTRFAREADGLIHAYQLQDEKETVTVSVWVSAEKRDAYMATQLRQEVDSTFPGSSRKVYDVKNMH
jgi:hypothetical protein